MCHRALFHFLISNPYLNYLFIYLFIDIMVTKTLIIIALGAAIGVSPWRNSKVVEFLIQITGG